MLVRMDKNYAQSVGNEIKRMAYGHLRSGGGVIL